MKTLFAIPIAARLEGGARCPQRAWLSRFAKNALALLSLALVFPQLIHAATISITSPTNNSDLSAATPPILVVANVSFTSGSTGQSVRFYETFGGVTTQIGSTRTT